MARYGSRHDTPWHAMALPRTARRGNRHGHAMVLHGVPPTGMVLHGHAIGMPWHCHGVVFHSIDRMFMQ